MTKFQQMFYDIKNTRDYKTVGEKFALKKLLKTEYYHTHYEEYDYSKYE